jgi:hypothetical protein
VNCIPIFIEYFGSPQEFSAQALLGAKRDPGEILKFF